MGQVARVGENRDKYAILLGKLDGQRHLKDLREKGNILLKWILKKQNWNLSNMLILITIETTMGCFACGKEPSGSTKYWKFLNYLRNY
jgi:hypothetical protein